jgi:DNA-binding HxlR family transcriptional regulator
MNIKLPPVLPGTDHAKLCPVRDVLDHIGDRWSFLALLALSHGTHRFTELQRAIGDVSKRVLAQTLRQLERDGFVHRTAFPEVPPRVEYQLTKLGASLVVQVEPLVHWAEKHHLEIKTARKKFKSPKAAKAL